MLKSKCLFTGACVPSYSGRCTLSNTFTLRDANRGAVPIVVVGTMTYMIRVRKISDDTLFSMSSKDPSNH